MALKKTLTLARFGTNVNMVDAYCSLQDVLVRQVQPVSPEANAETLPLCWLAEARLRCYVSAVAKTVGAEPFLEVPVRVQLSNENMTDIFGALYAAVKADTRFADAVDV